MNLHQVCTLVTILNCYLIHFECKMFFIIISAYVTYQKFSLPATFPNSLSHPQVCDT